jgi:hypothetical protein
MGYAIIKTKAVEFEPINPNDARPNSIYVDTLNANTFSNKNDEGTNQTVAAAPDSFAKQAKNMTGVTIPAMTPISRAGDGTIVPADSDAAQGQRPIGVTMEAILHNSFGLIGLVGKNITGALTSYSFSPGQDLYVSETGGYTADGNSFSGDNDSLILIGIADCADGDASASAPDLILLRQILVRP